MSIEQEACRETVVQLRRRRRGYVVSANLILFLMICCLGGGIYIFLFADRSQSAGQYAYRAIEDFSSAQAGLLKSANSNSQHQASLNIIASTYSSIGSLINEVRVAEAAQARAVSGSGETRPFSSELAVGRMAETALKIEQRLDRAQENISEVLELGIKRSNDIAEELSETSGRLLYLIDLYKSDRSSPITEKDLISSVFTRGGALIILLITLQVLGRLYRQAVSLATEYQTMADALTLWGARVVAGKASDKDLERLIHTLRPPKLEMPDIKVPFEQLAEVAKAAFSKRKSDTKKGGADGAGAVNAS